MYRWWRIVGTGLSFLMFYCGCLVIGPALILCALLRNRDERMRALFLQRSFHRLFGAFTFVMSRCMRLATFEWDGFEALGRPRGRLIVANHPTLIDVVLLIARLPEVDCIVKAELFANPFTRHCVTAAGFVPNSEGPGVVEAAVERLLAGHDVLLFPEGTRSPVRGLRPFQRGAARIAAASGCDILPVFVRCVPPMLFKGSKWFHAPVVKPRITLRVGAALRPQEWRAPGLPQSAEARTITQLLERRFAKELNFERA